MREELRPDPSYRATLVFALAMICYAGNGQTLGALDTVPARVLPLAILRQGTFALEQFRFLHREGRPYYLVESQGHYLSLYPVGAALAALPFYLPAVIQGVDPDSPRVEELEKLASAAIVALSVALFYLALRSVGSEAWALLLAATYALGTAGFSTCSQALWQHGPAALAFAAALYCLVRARVDGVCWRAGLAGLPLAFAVVCRPTNLALFVPIALYVARRHPRSIPLFVASASIPVMFQVLYNVTYFGDPLWSPFPFGDTRWRGQPRQTLPGLLLSPSRGLFVYSPVLLFAYAGILRSLRSGGDGLVRAIGAGTLLDLALYAHWWEWWGGGSYGPRLLADLSPLLCFAIHPVAGVVARAAAARAAFAVLLGWSVVAHAAGVYWDDRTWNEKLKGAERLEALWSWSDNQLANSIRQASLQLLAASVNRAPGVSADKGPEIALGWALDDQLELLGVDARPAAEDELEVVYHWRAARRLDDDYAVFTRLVGPGCGDARGNLLIGAPARPTSRWEAGETLAQAQRLRIPAAATCELQVGVWDPDERRPLAIRRWPVWQKTATALVISAAPSGLRITLPQ